MWAIFVVFFWRDMSDGSLFLIEKNVRMDGTVQLYRKQQVSEQYTDLRTFVRTLWYIQINNNFLECLLIFLLSRFFLCSIAHYRISSVWDDWEYWNFFALILLLNNFVRVEVNTIMVPYQKKLITKWIDLLIFRLIALRWITSNALSTIWVHW